MHLAKIDVLLDLLDLLTTCDVDQLVGLVRSFKAPEQTVYVIAGE
jgi:hypothetical protein